MDPRYTVLSSPDVEGQDGTFAYTIAGWPVLNSYARYQYAKSDGYDRLVTNTENYFLNEDAMQEGSPQGILDRDEDADMPAFLIIQGTADLNIPMSIPRSFAMSYRIAGGDVELEEFPESPHNFVTEASEATDRALELRRHLWLASCQRLQRSSRL